MKRKTIVSCVLILASAFSARPQGKYPPETKNAALRYWMAFAEMQDAPEDMATMNLLARTAAGEAAWDEKRLGPILDANDLAIRIMQRATKLPECNWGLEYDQMRTSIAYAPRARVLARLNTLEGMREMARGDSQDAVETLLAGIRFSEHVANGGPLIFALVGKSALMPNLQALATESKQAQLTESQKKLVSASLKNMREDGFDWSAAWELEELSGERFLAELSGAKDLGAAYKSLMGEPLPTGTDAPSTDDVRHYREYMKAVQAALNLPPETAKMRLSALETQNRGLPAVARRIIPSAQKVNDSRAEIAAARNELLAALSAN